MADINVERKGPSIWPWIIGLLVLALLIWAIAEMVDTDEPEMAGVEEVDEMQPGVQPPAAVPAPGMQPGEAEAVDLQTLMPLGTDDVGRTVRARGTVVGQPTDEGYWLLTDQDAVVFVLTQEGRSSGENVELTGRIAPTRENQARTWMEQANLTPAAGWQVNESVFIAHTAAGQPGAGQAAPRTGAAPTTTPGARSPGTQQ